VLEGATKRHGKHRTHFMDTMDSVRRNFLVMKDNKCSNSSRAQNFPERGHYQAAFKPPSNGEGATHLKSRNNQPKPLISPNPLRNTGTGFVGFKFYVSFVSVSPGGNVHILVVADSLPLFPQCCHHRTVFTSQRRPLSPT